jgi:hypothetical protein
MSSAVRASVAGTPSTPEPVPAITAAETAVLFDRSGGDKRDHKIPQSQIYPKIFYSMLPFGGCGQTSETAEILVLAGFRFSG